MGTKIDRMAIVRRELLRVAFPKMAAKIDQAEWKYWGLDRLLEGQPTVLYHGTTKSFKAFDLSRSRDELVDRFYGKGIFLTPSKRVAESYAEANRNIGFDPSIIQDLKRVNPAAGKFLEMLYKVGGSDAWETFLQKEGFWEPGQAADMEAFEDYLGVDPNSLTDIAEYIIGSKEKFSGGEPDALDLFSTSTGAPEYLYDTLDEVGLDSEKYRPKVYTVVVRVQNPLVTARKSEARKARSKGYDAVIFHGSDLVRGVPEVAVFDPRKVKISKVELA